MILHSWPWQLSDERNGVANQSTLFSPPPLWSSYHTTASDLSLLDQNHRFYSIGHVKSGCNIWRIWRSDEILTNLIFWWQTNVWASGCRFWGVNDQLNVFSTQLSITSAKIEHKRMRFWSIHTLFRSYFDWSTISWKHPYLTKSMTSWDDSTCLDHVSWVK